MEQMTVSVDKKLIDAEALREVKRLETNIKRLKTTNEKLREQIRDQKFKFAEAKRIVVIASDIAAEFGEDWG